MKQKSTPDSPKQTDYEVGRLLDAIQEEGQQDNTHLLTIFGDNGASTEGGPGGHDARDVTVQAKTIEERKNSAEPAGKRTLLQPLRGFVGLGAQFALRRNQSGCMAHGRHTDPPVVCLARTHQARAESAASSPMVNDIAADHLRIDRHRSSRTK